MLVNLFINVGIMLVAIYFYFSVNRSSTNYRDPSWTHYLMYTLGLSIVGISQMIFSITIYEIRLDFRGLLFAIAFKYFDLKTAISSLIFLTLARFMWGQNNVSLLNLANGVYLLISLPLLAQYMKTRFSESTQLAILLANGTLITSISLLILIKDVMHSLQLIILLWLANFLLLFFCVAIIKDLTKMVKLINNDCLTSLNNQRRFQEDLGILESVEKDLSIALLDIDHFKLYNDTFGHEVGDMVLQKFSELLTARISLKTNAYRVGGEEFALIMTGKSQEEAEELVYELREIFEKTPYLGFVNQAITQPTVSIGLAHRVLSETPVDTYRRADQALYFSKNNGRNQVKVAQYPPIENVKVEEASNDGLLMQVDQVSQVIQAKLTAQSLQSPETIE